MDRLASLRKELGLESKLASEDNSQDVDAEGRLSSGMDNTARVRLFD